MEREITINSKGKILTSSEEVLFDSEDFKTLSNKIDDVNDSLEWKILGGNSTGTKISLPSSYRELLVTYKVSDNEYYTSTQLTKNDVVSTTRFYYAGSANIQSVFSVDTTGITPIGAQLSGTTAIYWFSVSYR